MERRVVRFFGRVQGVGFRYTVEALARRHARVAGCVLNEAHHVTLDIEGSAPALDGFVADILRSLTPGAHVESQEVVSMPLDGFEGFTVGRTRSIERVCRGVASSHNCQRLRP